MKPKLLFLAPQNPYPPIDGGKIGIYYPVKYLSKYFEVYFVTPVKIIDERVRYAIKHFECLGIKYFPVEKDTDDNIYELIKNVFLEVPFKWHKYFSKKIYNLCKDLISSEKVMYIFTSTPHMALYSIGLKKRFPEIKIFLREHNIEFSLINQFIDVTKNPLFKIIGKWQLKKTKTLEQRYWELFDKIFFISDYDIEIAKKLKPKLTNKIYLLYDGFELNNVSYKNKDNYDHKFIIPSNINSFQNKVNMKWFLENIWIPSLGYIKQKKYVLSITGGEENQWKKILGYNNLEYLNVKSLGVVENIDEVLSKSKYIISPTIMGSGIRLKILHGMALGKVVMATKYDVLSIKVFRDMDNVIEFENATEFFKKIRKLEAELSLYNALSKKAIETIKYYFSWENYAKTIYNHFIKDDL